ncbi:MAG: hypothetical protein JMN25_14370 [gamma proteobacterium endosymbiont of Lamellibrachia anaximandri]|nr:hypothetical protein [gamma proteobacterium endosymbiont of Lamellibrachia anaximandri]
MSVDGLSDTADQNPSIQQANRSGVTDILQKSGSLDVYRVNNKTPFDVHPRTKSVAK